ncbi:MAG: alpha/beta hydrolase family protein [Gemmataceae bacterium]
MKPVHICILGTSLLAGCGFGGPSLGPVDTSVSLTDARKGFVSTLKPIGAEKEPVDEPSARVFRKLKFPAPPGQLAAYLTPDPKDGQKHPAIIWITGGDCNSIGDVWSAAKPDNDQTAAAFRKAGIVMMFPSLRGGNDNPGVKESFLGEVDDILAAADFLAKQPYVDPARLYLGGHSTGGTLVLLTAECSDRFRAVFSFGPVEDVAGYPPEYLPFDQRNPKEIELRSPGRWLHSIKSPVFVLEGTNGGNLSSLQAMARGNSNPKVQFLPVRGATHFSILAPVTKLLATKVLADSGPTCTISLSEGELNKLFGR